MKIFRKGEIFTIPNLLSTFRIVLIPIILWLYLVKRDFTAALISIGVSAVTDVADGFIARHFNMVTDLGKALDPIADKLTQVALILCITMFNYMAWYLVGLLAVKEITQGAMALVAIKRSGYVPSSSWFGKLSTAVLYVSMALLLLFPTMPKDYANFLIAISMAVLALSMVLYIIKHSRMIRDAGQANDA